MQNPTLSHRERLYDLLAVREREAAEHVRAWAQSRPGETLEFILDWVPSVIDLASNLTNHLARPRLVDLVAADLLELASSFLDDTSNCAFRVPSRLLARVRSLPTWIPELPPLEEFCGLQHIRTPVIFSADKAPECDQLSQKFPHLPLELNYNATQHDGAVFPHIRQCQTSHCPDSLVAALPNLTSLCLAGMWTSERLPRKLLSLCLDNIGLQPDYKLSPFPGTLARLEIGGSDVRGVPEKAIVCLPRLRSLSLGNKVHISVRELACLPRLEELRLYNLVEDLNLSPCLRLHTLVLRVSHSLSFFVRGQCPTLETFHVGLRWPAKPAETEAAWISTSVQAMPHLRELWLHSNMVGTRCSVIAHLKLAPLLRLFHVSGRNLFRIGCPPGSTVRSVWHLDSDRAYPALEPT